MNTPLGVIPVPDLPEQSHDGLLREVRRLQSELRNMEQLLQSIIASTPDCIVVWDQHYNYLYANKSAIEHVGTTPEQVLGGNMRDGLGHLPEFLQLWMTRVDAVFATGESLQVQDRVVIGQRFVDLESILLPVRDEYGQMFAVSVVYRDVTAGKQAEKEIRGNEAKLQTISDSALDAIVMIDGQGRVVHWNTAAERMFGYRAAEMLGRDPHALLCPQCHAERAKSGFERFFVTGEGPALGKVLELQALRKDGTEFPIEIAISAIQMEGQRWALAIIRDISERKRSQAVQQQHDLELRIAEDIQQHLQPVQPPAIPGFDIAGATYPAEFTAGDFFDYFDYLWLLDRSLCLAIGDVSGHGLGPALLAVSTETLLRVLAETHVDLCELITRANFYLVRQTDEERFVTLLFGRLDPVSRVFRYVNAGHTTGYVLDQSGAIKVELKSTAMPLGVSPDATYPEGAPVTLTPGDLLVLLTDGIVEARSPTGEQFGSRRALDVIRAHDTRTAREIIDRLHRAVCAFTQQDRLEDDATAIIVKVAPAA